MIQSLPNQSPATPVGGLVRVGSCSPTSLSRLVLGITSLVLGILTIVVGAVLIFSFGYSAIGLSLVLGGVFLLALGTYFFFMRIKAQEVMRSVLEKENEIKRQQDLVVVSMNERLKKLNEVSDFLIEENRDRDEKLLNLEDVFKKENDTVDKIQSCIERLQCLRAARADLKRQYDLEDQNLQMLQQEKERVVLEKTTLAEELHACLIRVELSRADLNQKMEDVNLQILSLEGRLNNLKTKISLLQKPLTLRESLKQLEEQSDQYSGDLCALDESRNVVLKNIEHARSLFNMKYIECQQLKKQEQELQQLLVPLKLELKKIEEALLETTDLQAKLGGLLEALEQSEFEILEVLDSKQLGVDTTSIEYDPQVVLEEDRALLDYLQEIKGKQDFLASANTDLKNLLKLPQQEAQISKLDKECFEQENKLLLVREQLDSLRMHEARLNLLKTALTASESTAPVLDEKNLELLQEQMKVLNQRIIALNQENLRLEQELTEISLREQELAPYQDVLNQILVYEQQLNELKKRLGPEFQDLEEQLDLVRKQQDKLAGELGCYQQEMTGLRRELEEAITSGAKEVEVKKRKAISSLSEIIGEAEQTRNTALLEERALKNQIQRLESSILTDPSDISSVRQKMQELCEMLPSYGYLEDMKNLCKLRSSCEKNFQKIIEERTANFAELESLQTRHAKLDSSGREWEANREEYYKFLSVFRLSEQKAVGQLEMLLGRLEGFLTDEQSYSDSQSLEDISRFKASIHRLVSLETTLNKLKSSALDIQKRIEAAEGQHEVKVEAEEELRSVNLMIANQEQAIKDCNLKFHIMGCLPADIGNGRIVLSLENLRNNGLAYYKMIQDSSKDFESIPKNTHDVRQRKFKVEKQLSDIEGLLEENSEEKVRCLQDDLKQLEEEIAGKSKQLEGSVDKALQMELRSQLDLLIEQKSGKEQLLLKMKQMLKVIQTRLPSLKSLRRELEVVESEEKNCLAREGIVLQKYRKNTIKAQSKLKELLDALTGSDGLLIKQAEDIEFFKKERDNLEQQGFSEVELTKQIQELSSKLEFITTKYSLKESHLATISASIISSQQLEGTEKQVSSLKETLKASEISLVELASQRDRIKSEIIEKQSLLEFHQGFSMNLAREEAVLAYLEEISVMLMELLNSTRELGGCLLTMHELGKRELQLRECPGGRLRFLKSEIDSIRMTIMPGEGDSVSLEEKILLSINHAKHLVKSAEDNLTRLKVSKDALVKNTKETKEKLKNRQQLFSDLYPQARAATFNEFRDALQAELSEDESYLLCLIQQQLGNQCRKIFHCKSSLQKQLSETHNNKSMLVNKQTELQLEIEKSKNDLSICSQRTADESELEILNQRIEKLCSEKRAFDKKAEDLQQSLSKLTSLKVDMEKELVVADSAASSYVETGGASEDVLVNNLQRLEYMKQEQLYQQKEIAASSTITEDDYTVCTTKLEELRKEIMEEEELFVHRRRQSEAKMEELTQQMNIHTQSIQELRLELLGLLPTGANDGDA